MLNLEEINKEIEKLEQSDKLTRQVCADLSGLYMIRDKMECKGGEEYTSEHEGHYSSMPKAARETVDLNIYPVAKLEAKPFTRAIAEKWVMGMENDDGTTGPHYTFEQAQKTMAEREIDGSPSAFFVVLNMMYSDYCNVAKKFGVNNIDFYAKMAEAFLNDKDAVGGGGSEKLAHYYEYVVK